MREVFLDTAYLIALEASRDQHHAAASRHWQALVDQSPRLVTTSAVFDEVVTFFSVGGQHEKAVRLGRALLSTPYIRVHHVDEALFAEAFEYLARRRDKRFSFTDCISFVLMQRLGIDDALTFDAHFEQAGFRRLPEAD